MAQVQTTATRNTERMPQPVEAQSVWLAPYFNAQVDRRRIEWVVGAMRGATVLEVGCGDGQLVQALAREGFRVLGLDSRESAISLARENLSRCPPAVQELGRVDLRLPESLDLGGERFDSVVLTGVLARSTRPEELLRSAMAHLRPDGRLVVVTPYGHTPDESQRNLYSLQSFVELVKPYCTPVELTVEDGNIRFIGGTGAATEHSWAEFGTDRLLPLAEKAGHASQEELLRILSWLKQDYDRIKFSVSFQAGQMLVRAAKEPKLIWSLPRNLLRMYVANRRTMRSGRWSLTRKIGLETIPALSLARPNPPARPIVAAILDRFSEVCLSYDANLSLLSRDGWRETLQNAKPDLLLVESAWSGNYGQWNYQIANLEERAESPLRDLVSACKALGVPTVFWNKEDPPGFMAFREAAKLFDYVFTTDANCIPRYHEWCGHNRVYALPFAAQPEVHNPRRMPDWPLHSVCFAGSWMRDKYAQRQSELAALLEAGLGYGLHIFDRNLPSGDERTRFPDKFRSAIQGTLDYERMLAAYRCYRVMLNANSVSDSPTMFSRRVFESLACGTPVVSTGSKGMRAILGGVVRVARDKDEASTHLGALLGDEPLRLREAHLGYREVHLKHTYRHRLNDVLAACGMPAQSVELPSVSVLLATRRPDSIEHCLESFTKQRHERKELWLILNNAKFDVDAITRRVSGVPNAHVLHMDGPCTLGDALNRALERASGDYIAKIDDDDLYGEHYLSDSLIAARFSRAEIVGKGTYFTYMSGAGQMAVRVLRPEHDFTELVSGATLLVKRAVMRRIRFRQMKQGTDSAFLADARMEGCRIYSADRFNFVLVRQEDVRGHTWQISERELLKNSHEVQSGLDLGRVMI